MWGTIIFCFTLLSAFPHIRGGEGNTYENVNLNNSPPLSPKQDGSHLESHITPPSPIRSLGHRLRRAIMKSKIAIRKADVTALYTDEARGSETKCTFSFWKRKLPENMKISVKESTIKGVSKIVCKFEGDISVEEYWKDRSVSRLVLVTDGQENRAVIAGDYWHVNKLEMKYRGKNRTFESPQKKLEAAWAAEIGGQVTEDSLKRVLMGRVGIEALGMDFDGTLTSGSFTGSPKPLQTVDVEAKIESDTYKFLNKWVSAGGKWWVTSRQNVDENWATRQGLKKKYIAGVEAVLSKEDYNLIVSSQKANGPEVNMVCHGATNTVDFGESPGTQLVRGSWIIGRAVANSVAQGNLKLWRNTINVVSMRGGVGGKSYFLDILAMKENVFPSQVALVDDDERNFSSRNANVQVKGKSGFGFNVLKPMEEPDE